MKVVHLAPADPQTRATRQAELDTIELRDQIDARLWRYEGRLATEGQLPMQPLRRLLRDSSVRLVHLYGRAADPQLLKGLPVPWIGEPQKAAGPLPWRRIPAAAAVTDDYGRFPESVSREYLGMPAAPAPEWMVASVAGPERSEMLERTLERISRFRGDVAWTEFSALPPAEELIRVRLWVDCGVDADGGSLEALACGLPVIACRTNLTLARSAGGSAAWLVPPGDANELAHAIVNALFRPERMEHYVSAAQARRNNFDPASRAANLLALYLQVAP